MGYIINFINFIYYFLENTDSKAEKLTSLLNFSTWVWWSTSFVCTQVLIPATGQLRRVVSISFISFSDDSIASISLTNAWTHKLSLCWVHSHRSVYHNYSLSAFTPANILRTDCLGVKTFKCFRNIVPSEIHFAWVLHIAICQIRLEIFDSWPEISLLSNLEKPNEFTKHKLYAVLLGNFIC